jgi:hypothetical protein
MGEWRSIFSVSTSLTQKMGFRSNIASVHLPYHTVVTSQTKRDNGLHNKASHKWEEPAGGQASPVWRWCRGKGGAMNCIPRRVCELVLPALAKFERWPSLIRCFSPINGRYFSMATAVASVLALRPTVRLRALRSRILNWEVLVQQGSMQGLGLSVRLGLDPARECAW